MENQKGKNPTKTCKLHEKNLKSALITEITTKNNWKTKIFDADIVSKWKTESIEHGMTEQQFDETVQNVKNNINKKEES